MSKQLRGTESKHQETLRFYAFWQFIAHKLGDSRLTINPYAKTIHHLFDANSDHKGFLRTAIRTSYKRNTCHHLNATINLSSVLDILGETAHDLKGSQSDDLMDIELLEEIAWHINERYGHIVMKEYENSCEELILHKGSARVVSLQRSKIRRANAKI